MTVTEEEVTQDEQDDEQASEVRYLRLSRDGDRTEGEWPGDVYPIVDPGDINPGDRPQPDGTLATVAMPGGWSSGDGRECYNVIFASDAVVRPDQLTGWDLLHTDLLRMRLAQDNSNYYQTMTSGVRQDVFAGMVRTLAQWDRSWDPDQAMDRLAEHVARDLDNTRGIEPDQISDILWNAAEREWRPSRAEQFRARLREYAVQTNSEQQHLVTDLDHAVESIDVPSPEFTAEMRYARIFPTCVANGYNGANDAMRALLAEFFPPGPPEIPPEVAALSAKQARTELTILQARLKLTCDALWQAADRKGFCDEFDEILVRCGWPPRPKTWVVTVNIRYEYETELSSLLPGEAEVVDGPSVVRVRSAVTLNRTGRYTGEDKARAAMTEQAARELLGGHQADYEYVSHEIVSART